MMHVYSRTLAAALLIALFAAGCASNDTTTVTRSHEVRACGPTVQVR